MRLRLLRRTHRTAPDAWGRPTTPGVFDVGVNVRLTREVSPLLYEGLEGTIERKGTVNTGAGLPQVWWVLFNFSPVARPIFDSELVVV